MDVAGLTDSKRINRAVFGVYYEEDVFERLGALWPAAMRAFSWRIPQPISQRKLIFIHVPRAAGTSIANALYGARSTRHYSMRYYRAINPAFCAQAQSFAVLRDPFDRFASAYAFVRGGGTPGCRLSRVFAATTAQIRCVDDYLAFVEDRPIFELDFVMRPQSWFVCDLESGTPLVDHLFVLGESMLPEFLRHHGAAQLARLNQAERSPLLLSGRQKHRIERLYNQDFALIAAVRARRVVAQEAMRIAAE